MCGISGIVSGKKVSGRLLESIKNLEYRGYDSCGMAVLNASKAVVRKNTGYVADVADKEMFLSLDGVMGIAHTRWATHGGVTQLNAHPHLSCDGTIALVHNGIISNYLDIKKKLEGKGHLFKSETDSEVIVHLMEEKLKSGKGFEQCFVATLRELDGTYAVAMVSTNEPEHIYCGKYESPLIIGLGENENYVGSDFNAFIDYTKNSVVLDDGEYAIVSKESFIVKKIVKSVPVTKKITRIEWDAEMSKKGGFPHYMLKEIHEQPEAIRKVLSIDDATIRGLAESIVSARHAYLVGVGTTYYVAQLAQYYMASEAGISMPAISSDELTESVAVEKDDYILAVSQSGETYDTLSALKAAKKKKARTAAIVNVIGSSMSRLVDTVVMQRSGPEICVVSTKAAVAQITTLMRVAIETGVLTGKISVKVRRQHIREIENLPKLISRFINERSGFIHNLAQKHASHHNWLYLGRGKYCPVAMEAALKVKEVAYHHAEGMPTGFLKHGTIALIDDNMRSLVFVPPEKERDLYRLTMGAIEEIRARGGKVVAFHFSRSLATSKLLEDHIFIPSTSPFVAPLLLLVAAQLFAYFVATTLDRNVDKPRSLAKSVTVA